MANRACPSKSFSHVELESLLAVRRSLPQKGAGGSTPQREIGEAESPEASATPTLTTIAANAYAWGYNFVLPGPAVSALRDGGTFMKLLGAMPPDVEPLIPMVEAYLADNLAAVAEMDDGAGMLLTATWMAPKVLIPTPLEWQSISSWLGQDLVLSVDQGSTSSGAQVVSWTYDPSDNSDQLWSYVNNLYIYNLKSNKVVEIADSDPNSSARIQINDYTGGLNQQWAICGDGFIRSLMNGNLLNISGSSTDPGTPVISYPPKYPPALQPPSNQSWSAPQGVWSSCNNLVTVIKNNTPVIMTVQGTPQSTTVLAYGTSVQILQPGAVGVYVSNYNNTITGDNAMGFAVYSEVAPGVSVSFYSHQHQCAYEGAKVWVDNSSGANGYSLNSSPSDWYPGAYHEFMPGTIVSSLEYSQNG
ncbi:RICIN domain-containing protein [Streptomyces cinnabarinus]|uniref:RICIN domain-containing protein n=1 Tax=Streptomyces cinnabarinus TaxID=67287 RepID=A0ABY7KTK2_9ACTN|nr:ricin-type beta-trefoil lectin domain protein [Streptomyces cinnabarinus]WAZ26945.1 RICIN domain-containing protein [Streptomyces cinnabarinus]